MVFHAPHEALLVVVLDVDESALVVDVWCWGGYVRGSPRKSGLVDLDEEGFDLSHLPARALNEGVLDPPVEVVEQLLDRLMQVGFGDGFRFADSLKFACW